MTKLAANIKDSLNRFSKRPVLVKGEEVFTYSDLQKEIDGIVVTDVLRVPDSYEILSLAHICAAILNGRTFTPFKDVTESSAAYVLQTSGTTGSPKEFGTSFEALDAFIDSFHSMGYEFSENDSFLQMAEYRFDMSLISTLIPLTVGASIHQIEMRGIKTMEIIRTLQEKKTTVAILPPSAAKLLKTFEDEITFPELRLTFFGAEKLDAKTVELWRKMAPNSKIVNLYGPSEVAIFSTYFEVDYPAVDPIPIGRPVKNVEAKISNGELLLSGPQVFAGYTNSMSQSIFNCTTNQSNCPRSCDIH